jgi:hypothetical protein
MKRKIILLLFSTVLILNCNELKIQKEINPESTIVKTDKYSELNNRLKKAENIDTPVDLIKYYYGEIDNEEDIDIIVENLEKGQYIISLVHENIKDDSISGVKIIMAAQQNEKIWTVQKIDCTWKCNKNRGHIKYSSEPCL